MRLYDANMIPRLLNRQVKAAMHTLRQGLMREVLEELEKELRGRDKDSWAICFCVVLILCICVEDAQTSMDALTMHLHVHGEDNAISSEVTAESCRRLDDSFFRHLHVLFHGIYKSHKPAKPNGNRHSYNPIRDTPKPAAESDSDVEATNLVMKIRQIITDYGRQISYVAGRGAC